MELTDRFDVSASRRGVGVLLGPALASRSAWPGCESIEGVGGGAYRARMAQRVGPFRVTLDMEMRIDEAVEGQRVVVSGTGKDRMGNPCTSTGSRSN